MMDMHSRNQYLNTIRNDYWQVNKKEKGQLLDEAEKRTALARKYLIKKLKPTTNLRLKKEKRSRKEFYDGYVKAALVEIWRIFDYACGQRLASLLSDEEGSSQVDRLRYFDELKISDEVADKLKQISSATIDRKLAHQKEVERIKRKYHPKNNPLLYKLIPVKADGWDTIKPGEEQIDLVEHCGNSAAGEFICSLSTIDIASGWWEGQAQIGRSQRNTFQGLQQVRARMPFDWREIHPDNDTAFINYHLYHYAVGEKLDFSRSRPYQKNDNCFVEQKNSTHIRQIFGHLRYDTWQEMEMINDLYKHELRLYKNFFQPVMRLKEKIRIKGAIKRKYDKSKTPYQRLMASDQIDEKTKEKLKALYVSLNPAALKRNIDEKLKKLYQIYQEKNKSQKVEISKKLQPTTVTFLKESKANFGNIVK